MRKILTFIFAIVVVLGCYGAVELIMLGELVWGSGLLIAFGLTAYIMSQIKQIK